MNTLIFEFDIHLNLSKPQAVPERNYRTGKTIAFAAAGTSGGSEMAALILFNSRLFLFAKIFLVDHDKGLLFSFNWI